MPNFDWQHHSALPDPRQHPEFYAEVGWRRVVAFVLDGFCFAVILVICVTTLVSGDAFNLTAQALLLPLLLGLPLLYYVGLPLLIGSATPGQWVMGVEMRDRNGYRFGFGLTLGHFVLFCLLSLIPFMFVINTILILVHPTAKGVHDLILGTAVIRRPE